MSPNPVGPRSGNGVGRSSRWSGGLALCAAMEVYRTPDAAFDHLPDFPWEPAYAEVTDPDGGTLRMAYVDVGPADAPVALLLHGEPSWSFLYRHVIRVLVEDGIRCVAPDLVGFGRSDKPLRRDDYTLARMVEWTRQLAFDHLDLGEITLVGQDWGGLIGLRLVAEHPERFARVVAANTGLPAATSTCPRSGGSSVPRSRRPRSSTSGAWSPPAVCAR